jgi:hypothetical protein
MITIRSVEVAIERLVERQVERGGIPAQPAYTVTKETDAGWALFNVNGYLGTVTTDGEVIVEDEYLDEDE